MYEFIKKNIYLIILFIITLSIGFLTFLTFIDKGFIELSDQNLQILLVLNIVLLITLFVFIFIEIKNAIKNDIDKDGLKSNKKYITYFGLFTLIPSVLISIFSLFLFSFALEKYFDKKVTTVVNNSYELARNYVEEITKKKYDKIVISPGPGNPNQSGNCIKILKSLYKELPFLGVCLGHQIIGQVFGSKIIQARKLMHGKTSKIKSKKIGILKNLPNTFEATR